MSTISPPAPTRKKLRIVQVAPDYYPVPPLKYGGIERVVHTLTEALVADGHEVYLYAPAGSKTQANLIAYEHTDASPQSIAAFVARTLPSSVDIIHDHTHKSAVGMTRLPVPTLCTFHATVHNPVDFPVYVSQHSRLVAGTDQGEYAYNGLPIDDYPLADPAVKQDYLLYLGVLSWHKGILQAIDMAESTGHRLMIAGPIFDASYYTTYIEPRLKRNPNLQYIGEVGGEDRIRLLQQAKCMLFPTCCEEAFGLVMIEAMACGTPVLALANGAVPEVLAGMPELICRSITEMQDRLRKSCFPSPESLRDYVEQHYSSTSMAERYLELYQHAIHQYMNEPGDLQVLHSVFATTDDKIAACGRLAHTYYEFSNLDMERNYVYQAFELDAPRAEFCCRLGYQYLKRNDLNQARFWYELALNIDQISISDNNDDPEYEACRTWLPHLQLCVINYRLGNLAQSYAHNEAARAFSPLDQYILSNKELLENELRSMTANTSAPPVAEADKPSLSPEEPSILESLGPEVEVDLMNDRGELFTLALKLPGFIEETLCAQGSWEPFLIRKICEYMQPDGVFIDIGANIGYHTFYLASEFPEATCLCFEPHPTLYQQLQENIQLNAFNHVQAFELAVGNTKGKIDFYMQDDSCYNRGMSGIQYHSEMGDAVERVQVNITTLDQHLDQAAKKRVQVMKIDTQGHEFEVICGALDTIRQSKPVIFLEYHSYARYNLHAIMTLLPHYQWFKIQPWTGEMVTLDEPDPAGYQNDYIAIPEHRCNLTT